MEWERARTDEQKEQRVAEIVAATERLYEKYSFEEITFVMIAEEANFTRSNLYKYFSSKEEIFLEFVKNDIKLYVKNLVKEFSKDKNYSVEQFVSIWVKILVKHKRLLNLIGILFAFLEKNCSVESLTDFKFATKDELMSTVELICLIFPEISPEKAKDFFYLQFASAVGLYQMTDLSEVQKIVMENPELKDFKIDFEPYYKDAVEHLIKGLLNSK
ncbi:MAG: TetR/AcrR family transcriptional regulator [Thermodesulfobacteriota bacterium]